MELRERILWILVDIIIGSLLVLLLAVNIGVGYLIIDSLTQ